MKQQRNSPLYADSLHSGTSFPVYYVMNEVMFHLP